MLDFCEIIRLPAGTLYVVGVVVVVVVLTLTRIIKLVVTWQASVTLELRNTPGKKHNIGHTDPVHEGSGFPERHG